jgi:hypothetical protein
VDGGYPILAPVRFRQLRGKQNYSGEATCMSSASVVIRTEDCTLHIGDRVKASMDWPAVLDGRVALQLVISGAVIWRDEASFVLEFSRTEFRTRGIAQTARSAQ